MDILNLTSSFSSIHYFVSFVNKRFPYQVVVRVPNDGGKACARERLSKQGCNEGLSSWLATLRSDTVFILQDCSIVFTVVVRYVRRQGVATKTLQKIA